MNAYVLDPPQRTVASMARPARAPLHTPRARGAGSELSAVAARRGVADVPRPDELDLTVVNQPKAPAPGPAPAPTPTPAPKAPDPCGTPLAMAAVTTGAFGGSKTMDDYYPDLKGTGAYLHPGSGGPFDTGTWVGANAQLVGTVPKTCRSADFTIGQTVTFTRARVNGFKVDIEGTSADDIAAAAPRDQAKAPFRQVWTKDAITSISMADPPSVKYGPRKLPLAPPVRGTPPSEYEWDRDFVTTLSGSGGTKSVAWKTSIRVEDGKVTANTIS